MTVDNSLDDIFSTLLSNLMHDSSFLQLIMYTCFGKALYSSHDREQDYFLSICVLKCMSFTTQTIKNLYIPITEVPSDPEHCKIEEFLSFFFFFFFLVYYTEICDEDPDTSAGQYQHCWCLNWQWLGILQTLHPAPPTTAPKRRASLHHPSTG